MKTSAPSVRAAYGRVGALLDLYKTVSPMRTRWRITRSQKMRSHGMYACIQFVQLIKRKQDDVATKTNHRLALQLTESDPIDFVCAAATSLAEVVELVVLTVVVVELPVAVVMLVVADNELEATDEDDDMLTINAAADAVDLLNVSDVLSAEFDDTVEAAMEVDFVVDADRACSVVL